MKNSKILFTAILFLFFQANIFAQTYIIDNMEQYTDWDYSSIQDAIDAHQNPTSEITFQIIANEGNPYNELIDINIFSSPDIVTFEPHPSNGITPVVIEYEASSEVDNYVVRFNNAMHVTLKGITIRAIGNDNYSRVIDFVGENNNYITIDSCELQGQVVGEAASQNCVIFCSGDINNITINNCNIENGSDGINLGSTNDLYSQNISNNTINNFNNIGIYLNNQYYSNVYNNEIYGKPTNAPNLTGIKLDACGDENNIYNNIIQLSATTSNKGIDIETTASEVSSINKFYNNMITLKNANLDNIGINNNNSYKSKIYHNSINIQAGNHNSAVIKVDGSQATTYYVDIINNILQNMGQGYIYIITDKMAIYSNNNILFPEVGNFIQSNSNEYNTLEEWIYFSTFDDASYTIDPNFFSDTDLHLHKFSIAENSAMNIVPPITTDIDGDIRNVEFPDIGADEDFFAHINNDITITGTIGIYYDIYIDPTRTLTT